MSRTEKSLEKWLENTPVEERKETVIAMLERYFEGQYQEKPGSHIVVWDDRLKEIGRAHV